MNDCPDGVISGLTLRWIYTFVLLLLEIGRISAQLRYIHLEAHLRQQQLLTPAQRQEYDVLRGYQSMHHDHQGHPKTPR